MIISHKHKFIFFKSTKTASTSIEVSLASVCGKEDIVTPITLEGLDPSYRHPVRNINHRLVKEFHRHVQFFEHMRPQEVYKFVDKTIWENYTKIMAIRNPWDRVISQAFMRKELLMRKIASGLLMFPPKAGELLVAGPLRYGDSLNCRLASTSLKDVLLNLLALSKVKPPPFYKWANIEKEICIDFFIRFEDLNKDFSELCQRLNIDPIELPFAKGNFRTEKKHYTEYYENETREIVAEKYKKDIEMFEYKFEN